MPATKKTTSDRNYSAPGRGEARCGTPHGWRVGPQPLPPISTPVVLLAAVVLSLFWGLAFVWIKMALEDIGPVELTVWRFIFACIFFVPFLVWRRKEFAKITRADIPGIVGLGLVGMAGYHFLLNWGEQYTYSGTASLIIASAPIFTMVAATFFLKERFTPAKGLGVVLALSGVTALTFQGGIRSGDEVQTAIGALAVLGSALTAAAFTVGAKKYLERIDVFIFVAAGTFVSLLALLPAMWWEGFTPLGDISTNTWLSILALAGLSTIVSYGLFFTILKHQEASRATMYVYLVPVFALAAGVVMLGEKVGPLTIVGALLVLLGVWVVTRKRSRSGRGN